jgi:2-keto-4-pentenoate hydratase/2-oxohepta-3-ene-1,7-dioic acid hydratase in catechol pathway
VSIRFANVDGRAALVDPDGGWHDLERLTAGDLGPDPTSATRAGTDALRAAAALLEGSTADGPLEGAVLGAPVPEPRSCFAIGLNYGSHAAESGMEVPSVPVVFTKFPSCLVGPHDDVVLAATAADYEVELVVVVGRTARDVPVEQAWDHVLGLTVGQDISDRALQFAAQPPHFDLGKSRDTYGPTGPVVVSPDLLDDPDDLELWCEVDGERRQHDRTSSLIVDVPHLVAYLSSILTLHPGDLVFTGTPDGVGAASQQFLRPGDVVTSHVEGIGTMRNSCVA